MQTAPSQPAATRAQLQEMLQDPSTPVLVLTGAGISAGSGLSTYRGPGGLYPTGTMPPMTRRDATSSRLPIMWEHLRPLCAAAASATPNAAHHALAQWAAARPGQTTIVTQNVDGLHHVAGAQAGLSPEASALELHGSLARLRCIKPGHAHVHPVSACEPDANGIPRCPSCQARMRPDVVLFEEALPAETWEAAAAGSARAEVVLAIGTSLQVWPANELIAAPLREGRIGGWFDLDPTRAHADLEGEDAAVFAKLTQIPGAVSETLPVMLGQSSC